MAEDVSSRFKSEKVRFEGEKYRYAVYVPDDYTKRRAWPAVLFMHGSGERGTDGERQTTVGIGRAIREHPERFPCIVIMPQCPPDLKWEGPMLDMALACLEKTEHDYNIDPERIVLTGLSLGGYGTWALGAACPERFSALVPVCGGGETSDAAALALTPIWCFHGDADPVVPVDRSREMVVAVRTAGGDVRFTELPGVGHNSWDDAYGNPELIAWMLQQRRPSAH